MRRTASACARGARPWLSSVAPPFRRSSSGPVVPGRPAHGLLNALPRDLNQVRPHGIPEMSVTLIGASLFGLVTVVGWSSPQPPRQRFSSVSSSRTRASAESARGSALTRAPASGMRASCSSSNVTGNPGPRDPTIVTDALRLWDESYRASQSKELERSVTARWVTARRWVAEGNEFAVEANVSRLLQQNGKGVYTVMVWALDQPEGDIVISHYSVFHRINPPKGYDPSQWQADER